MLEIRQFGSILGNIKNTRRMLDLLRDGLV